MFMLVFSFPSTVNPYFWNKTDTQKWIYLYVLLISVYCKSYKAIAGMQLVLPYKQLEIWTIYETMFSLIAVMEITALWFMREWGESHNCSAFLYEGDTHSGLLCKKEKQSRTWGQSQRHIGVWETKAVIIYRVDYQKEGSLEKMHTVVLFFFLAEC